MIEVIVERAEWKPAAKHTYAGEPPDDARVISGPATIRDADGGLVAVLDRLDDPALPWLGRHCGAIRWERETGDATRMSGMRVAHRVFGYVAAAPLRQRYATSICRLSREQPLIVAELERLALPIAERFAVAAPDEWAAHSALIAEAVLPEWRWGGAPWTSGVINCTGALPYHRDSGNLKGAWSAQVTLRNRVEGGYLHLPEYGVYLDTSNRSLAVFPGGALWHGVTPLRVKSRGWRYSIVYYAKSAMRRALAPAAEARRASLQRTEAEDRMAEVARERLAQ